MTGKRPCGACDGCRWAGTCVSLREPLPDLGFAAVHVAQPPPRPPTPAQDDPGRPRRPRATKRTPAVPPVAGEDAALPLPEIDDADALRLLLVWLRRLVKP